MKFDEILKIFRPGLISISKTLGYGDGSADFEDILQEMIIHLWDLWKKGKIDTNTRSYILQSCWFHAKNCIRKSKKSRTPISLEASYDDTDGKNNIMDFMLDDAEPTEEEFDGRMTIKNILSNGLSRREKDIFRFTLEGYTLRDIGEMLGVSFVTVYNTLEEVKRKAVNY
ncbi:MAG: sigma-70 family RNA polymerase sigma factor [Elusimicrobia bacterium]|nr:sigma-70 family RNA polymerase sigma factor [Elusimicrobiota bacterium]